MSSSACRKWSGKKTKFYLHIRYAEKWKEFLPHTHTKYDTKNQAKPNQTKPNTNCDYDYEEYLAKNTATHHMFMLQYGQRKKKQTKNIKKFTSFDDMTCHYFFVMIIIVMTVGLKI